MNPAAELVEQYLAKPYHLEVVYDATGETPGWFARVLEWPGCMTQAATFAELGEMIRDAMRAWVETGLEDGTPIPEPRTPNELSGQLVVRVPKSLHRELLESAAREGVSLNALANVALAKQVGLALSETLPAQRAPTTAPQLV